MSRTLLRRRNLIAAAIILLLVAAGIYWWHHNHTMQDTAQTTSTEKTAQSNYTSGKNHSNSGASTDQGGGTDNKGDNSATPGETGTASSTGIITVYAPTPDGQLSPGDVLRGAADGLAQVQYRVIDDQTGVVAQGSLQVVGGTYSGTLQFAAHSKSGRVDVYSYNAQGQEINEVEIPVSLGG